MDEKDGTALRDFGEGRQGVLEGREKNTQT